MWGSDLPGARSKRSFRPEDVALIAENVGDDLSGVFENNARGFYRLPLKEFAEGEKVTNLPLSVAEPEPEPVEHASNDGRSRPFQVVDLTRRVKLHRD
jgi:hypothetical protein